MEYYFDLSMNYYNEKNEYLTYLLFSLNYHSELLYGNMFSFEMFFIHQEILYKITGYLYPLPKH